MIFVKSFKRYIRNKSRKYLRFCFKYLISFKDSIDNWVIGVITCVVVKFPTSKETKIFNKTIITTYLERNCPVQTIAIFR